MNKNNDSFMFYPDVTDEDFNEKIYLKKEFRDTEITEKVNWNKPLESKKEFILEPHQLFLKNYISVDTPYNGILIFHGVGVGKCLAKGTPILMYDGNIKLVENIEVGDLLMGDDSTPRNVLSLARGVDKMYDIIQNNGDTYTVNSEHILCLKYENYNNYQKIIEINSKINKNIYIDIKNSIIEISIKDYLDLSDDIKKDLKGYKVEVDFLEKELPMDAYNFGYSLNKNRYRFDYHIPDIYKFNSKKNRLQLLLGFINNNGFFKNNLYNIDNITHNLMDDIIYIARSVGFQCKIDNSILYIDLNKKDLLTDIKVNYKNEDNYYGFTLDGNCRFLLGDFTVTHNTCTAIQIAEGFKKTLKNMNKKILILTNLRENFLKELYNEIKERSKKNPEDMVQCTGKEYQLGEESLYLTSEQKSKEIKKLKSSYYEIRGYQKFANDFISRTEGWKGDDKSITEKIKKIISVEFDNRVIIIDEIQNIKTDKREGYYKNIQPILQTIIRYAKNIKLILMSATPMFDRPDEIIFYLNLLLENDKRKLINKNEIFNLKNGTLKEGAEKKLKELFTGYISYIRGEKPYNFPFRIYPPEANVPKIEYYMSGLKIEQHKQIQFAKLIMCEMKNNQLNTYLYCLNKKIKEGRLKRDIDNKEDIINDDIELNEKKELGSLRDLIAISNISYPISKNKNYDYFDNFSINSNFDNGLSGYYKSVKMIGTKKKIQYKYQDHSIFNKNTVNETPFADEKYLENYSIKFSNIIKTIKNSKGLILIYSRFIDIGVVPLALALEQNGFDRYCFEGEHELLDYTPNKLKGGGKRRQICYLCNQEAKYIDHHDEKSKNFHSFKRAKYILCFGQTKDIIKISTDEAVKRFTSDKNKYGEEIKIFIGTEVIGEGLDFKRLRQVHIIEPWYNLSRHEQIIGRSIRYKSHNDLPFEERNVEIYQYASVLKKDNDLYERETVDLKNYRMAENKDIIIKNITRIMKESAVDCVLFRNTNIINSDKKIKQITSTGKIVQIPIADKPKTAICDYQDNCEYKCNWMPNPRIKYPVNTDTYNIKFSSNDIEKVKKDIKNLFRENIVYYLDLIERKILQKNPNIDKLFIYSALEEIANNKDEIIYDKFSRKGYIIYRGDYYIFQPFDLERDEFPMIYRVNPMDIKPEYIDLENIDVDYDYKREDKKENIIDEELLTNNTIKKINETYNSHIKIMEEENKEENKEKYMYAIIGTVLDKLKTNFGLIFIKNILIKNFKKIKEVNSIINYLAMNKILINYYSDIVYDKSKIKNNFYVGYVLNKEYYIIEDLDKIKDNSSIKINNINFIKSSKEIVLQIKFHRGFNKTKDERIYNNIYGITELDNKKDLKYFKIVNKSSEENILTKKKEISKRSIITGRTCSTFKYNKLEELRDKMKMYKITEKRKIDFICEDLEIYFRYKELLKANNKIWFENIEID